MSEVLDRDQFLTLEPVPGVDVDERAVRRTLREQIAKLEDELGTLFCSTYPRKGFEWGVASRGGPRLLSTAELARLRDELADALQHNRKMLSDRTYVEDLNRRRIEEMGSVLVAYSGGIDSTLVLKVAHDVLGPQAVGVTAVSPTFPAIELATARQVAGQIGARQGKCQKSCSYCLTARMVIAAPV